MSEKLPDGWLKVIRAAYPKRTGGQGWGHLKTRIPTLVADGECFADLLDGAKKYAALMNATGQTGTLYVMQARTFYGPGEWWLEDYDLPRDGSVELSLDQQAEQYGLARGQGESDDSLRSRVGTAVTKKQYGLA